MNNEKDETIYNVPLWEKVMLTIDEAAAYTGVGSRKIRQLTDNERCPFVLWNTDLQYIPQKFFALSFGGFLSKVQTGNLAFPSFHKVFLFQYWNI